VSNLRRGPASLIFLIGSTVVVASGACHKESELRSREHAGGEKAAGVAVAGTTSGAATAACAGSHPATCFLDTAHAPLEAIPGEDNPEAKWIFFAASGDSAEVSVDSSAITTNFGQERDAHQNTASSFHTRLAQSGVFEVALIIRPFLQGHSPPYVIRFRRFEASANSAFRATGERSLLTIESKSDTEVCGDSANDDARGYGRLAVEAGVCR
jgi:hypothetical protein